MQETDTPAPSPSWFERHFDTPRVRALRRLAIFTTAGVFFYLTLIKPALHRRDLGTFREQARAFAQGEPHPGLGSLDAVATAHRAAFAPGPGWAPLPEPQPGDWAHQFQEPTQDVPRYIGGEPNLVTEARDVLYIQPTGDFDPSRAPDMEMLRRFMQVYFQMETRLRPKMKGYSATQRTNGHTGKPQLLVGDLLDAMREDVPEDAYAVVALSTTDLYPDDSWGFVFGMASFSDRVGAYSVARFHEDFRREGAETPPALLLRRTLATMAHETGHMFSMSHCQHFQCLLNGSNSLRESDAGTLHLCPLCLRKLYHAHRFDPAKRYRELRDFYRAHDLDEEADWAAARLARLEQ